MSIRILLILAAGALLLPQGVLLERRPKVGEVARLRVTAEIDMFGEKATYTMLQTERVTSVASDGAYTLESKQTEAVVRYAGTSNSSPDSVSRSAVYRSNGELANVIGEVPSLSDLRTSRMSAFISPGREVKPGDGWTHEFPGSPQNGGISARSEFKSEGSQKPGDAKVHVIEFKFRELSGDAPAASAGKFWIDSETGNLVKLECQWTNAPMAGLPRPMNAKISIVREG